MLTLESELSPGWSGTASGGITLLFVAQCNGARFYPCLGCLLLDFPICPALDALMIRPRRYPNDLTAKIARDMAVIKWMLGSNLAFTSMILWKVFST